LIAFILFFQQTQGFVGQFIAEKVCENVPSIGNAHVEPWCWSWRREDSEVWKWLIWNRFVRLKKWSLKVD